MTARPFLLAAGLLALSLMASPAHAEEPREDPNPAKAPALTPVEIAPPAASTETPEDVDRGTSPEPIDTVKLAEPAAASTAAASTAKAPDQALPPEAATPPEEREPPAANGYLSNRFGYTHVNRSGPVSTADMPSLLELLELNLQLRVNLGSKQSFVYADASLFYQQGWLFRADGNRRLTVAQSHDIPELHPFFVPSELYLSSAPKPWLTFTVGKKRVIWGSGFAFNPTNLLSPAKDPTDPNLQRAGAWLARVELPFEKVTFTGLFQPEALYSQAGVPYALMYYPSYRAGGDTSAHSAGAHYIAAARVYALLYETDVNLMYFLSNHYQDAFEKKSRFGVSVSRYFLTDYELHLEALLSLGSARSFACGAECGTSPSFAQTKLNSHALYPRILLGTRRQFSDESMLSLEYYYQGDGYTRREFSDAVRLLYSFAPNTASGADASALPDRFTFEPLRRHYLVASYSKPHLFDDWSVSSVVIAGLGDLSGLFAPSVSWSTREWLSLSLYGFVPIHGLGVGEVRANGRRVSEYSLTPFDYQLLFEARAFY